MKGINIRMNVVKGLIISSIPQGNFKEKPLVELWEIQLLKKTPWLHLLQQATLLLHTIA